jgi:hypothetical protein
MGSLMTGVVVVLLVTLSGSASFRSKVPIVEIDTHGLAIPHEPRVSADMVIHFDPAESMQTPHSRSSYIGRVRIQLLGHSSLRFPKKSYAVELRDPHDDRMSSSLLGLSNEAEWVLHGPYSDKTLMRNYLAYALGRRLRLASPQTRFVELFIREGSWGLTYQGVYLLVEASARSPEVLGIAALGSADTTDATVGGGYVLEMDRVERGKDFITLPGDPMNIHRDTILFVQPRHPAPQQKQWLASYFDSLELSLSPRTSAANPKRYARFLDVDSFVDFLLLEELVKNIDAYRFSMSMYKDRGGTLKMGPIWDFDLSTGNAYYDDGCDTDGWLVKYFASVRNGKAPPRWWRGLLQDRSFVDRVRSRWAELRRGALATDSVRAIIDDGQRLLRIAEKRNFERWPTLGKRLWPNCPIPGSNPPAYYQTWEDEVSHLRSWTDARLLWMDAHIAELGPG